MVESNFPSQVNNAHANTDFRKLQWIGGVHARKTQAVPARRKQHQLEGGGWGGGGSWLSAPRIPVME